MKTTKIIYNAPASKFALVEATCEYCGNKKYMELDTSIKYVRTLADRVGAQICEKCGRTSK